MDDPTRREVFVTGVIGRVVAHPWRAGAPPKMLARRDWQPSYLRLEREGELKQRAQALYAIYKSCRLCPRGCAVNRLKREPGICGANSRVKIASAHPHFGEERPLTGRGGSGTIFFSHCSLLCEYCQNWAISHRGEGSLMSDEELGRLMVRLQERGCHNINLVTPTHFTPNIVQALRTAIREGLRIPLVYNCGGYEPMEVLRLLDGVIDIYLPDFKYSGGEIAAKYSAGASDYPEIARAAIAEMHRQAGDLTVDEQGIALRGLIIRHLVLPSNLAGTDQFVRWVAARLGRNTCVNIMPQYRPEFRAHDYPELSRRVTAAEFDQAIKWAREAGLTNIRGT